MIFRLYDDGKVRPVMVSGTSQVELESCCGQVIALDAWGIQCFTLTIR
jgi:hypothetical protein